MKSEEALKQTEQGIDELVKALEQGKSESLLRFLEFQARFHEYSFRNCLLIAMQKPEATYVAGFQRWKDLGRFVKKGEKGIMILAPIVRRRKSADDSQAAPDDDAGATKPCAAFGPSTSLTFRRPKATSSRSSVASPATPGTSC